MKAKRERAESKRNKAKVIKALIKNPLASQREIAKEAWVTVWTVNNKLNQVKQWEIKDDRILWICDADLEIVKLWQQIIKEKLTNKKVVDKMKAGEVSQVIAENTKRYTLFKWDATDKDWGLKSIEWITISIDWWV